MAADPILGMAAEFASPRGLVAAAQAARHHGYTRLDAFTPFPLPELDALMGITDTAIGWGCLIGFVVGGAFGFWLGWYINVVAYVLDIGGRPPNSWPAFLLPAFEMAVLLGALGALGTLMVQCGLPCLHHPVFEIPGFNRASDDRFFLLIAAADPHYDPARIRHLLDGLGALRVSEMRQRWSA